MTELKGATYLPRLHVRWPVKTLGNSRHPPIESETEEVSSNGFSVRITGQQFEVNEEIECLLFIPTFHPALPNDRMVLRCYARILGVGNPDASGAALLDCHIERYWVDHQFG
jgi:hypothetical protein